jgi:hypothetical protein
MIVKGMGKRVFRPIPLTTIPLTSLRAFLSPILAFAVWALVLAK